MTTMSENDSQDMRKNNWNIIFLGENPLSQINQKNGPGEGQKNGNTV